ncbi:retrotransposon protein, putative, unclassified [Tanacetum coccineum]
MHLFLKRMNVVYVLRSPILDGGDDSTMERIKKKRKWDNNDCLHRFNPQCLFLTFPIIPSRGNFIDEFNVESSMFKGLEHMYLHIIPRTCSDVLKDRLNGFLLNGSFELVQGRCMNKGTTYEEIEEEELLVKELLKLATLDESMLWHRRLGHINFKTINKLVKDNLVRGLPAKHLKNDQICVAALNGKAHKASLDETSGILKNFITEIKNLVDKKVKIIRCDNGKYFKNRVMNELCEMKGIQREFSDGPKWLFDIDSLTKSMNYVPVVAGTNSNDFAGSEESNGAGHTSKETEFSQDYMVMPTVGKAGLMQLGVLAYASFMSFMVYKMEFEVCFHFLVLIEEEVYVCQPPGFEDPDYPDKVYKVVKALYGLIKIKSWKFSFTDVRTASTPMDTEKPLLKDLDGDDVDCKKQTVVATSSTEAEYVVAASCCGQVLWIQNQMLDYGLGILRIWLVMRLSIKSWVTEWKWLPLLLPALKQRHDSVVNNIRNPIHDNALNEPSSLGPWFRDNILGSGEDNMKLMALMEHYTKLSELGREGFHHFGKLLSASIEMETWKSCTIDGKVKVLFEASIRRHLKLEDSDGISTLPTTEIFEQLALMGNMKRDSKGYTGVDTPLFQTMLVQGQILQGEGSTSPVKTLEKTIKSSKARRRAQFVVSVDEEMIHHDAQTQGRQEHDLEPNFEFTAPKRFIPLSQILVLLMYKFRYVVTEVSTAAESLVYIRRSAAKRKDKGKAIVEESEPTQTKTKIEQEQERIGFEEAQRIQEQFDEEERQRIANVHIEADEEWDNMQAQIKADEELAHRLQAQEREGYSEADKAKLLHMGSHTLQQLRGYSFDEIKVLFEATVKRVNTFTPMESDDTVPKVVAGSSKRSAEEELGEESSKRQKIGEGSEPAEESKDKESDELSQEQLQQLIIIVPEEGMNVEALQTKYPIIDWEVYTKDSRKYWKIIRVGDHTEVYQFFKDMLKNFDRDDLVKLWDLVRERFSSTKPTDDKERALWVELKRLFEPDTDDLLELQRYMHDPLTWSYSIERRTSNVDVGEQAASGSTLV